MKLGIKNKTALVTGGCNGIGESISIELAEEGVNLIVTSRSKEPIEKLKEKLKSFDIEIHWINESLNLSMQERLLPDFAKWLLRDPLLRSRFFGQTHKK